MTGSVLRVEVEVYCASVMMPFSRYAVKCNCWIIPCPFSSTCLLTFFAFWCQTKNKKDTKLNKLTLHEQKIVWPGFEVQKPKGIKISTHLQVFLPITGFRHRPRILAGLATALNFKTLYRNNIAIACLLFFYHLLDCYNVFLMNKDIYVYITVLEFVFEKEKNVWKSFEFSLRTKKNVRQKRV